MKHFVLLFILLFSSRLSAQWVDSVVVTPSAPTTNDTVKIYIYLSFPNSNCEDQAYGTLAGTTIQAYAFHCMGMLNSICYDTDTLIFPPMAAGNYTMYFSLDAGYGPPGNCSPGIVPYDHDTTYFTVSSVTGIPSNVSAMISVYPNPASTTLQVSNPSGGPAELQLLNLAGELLLVKSVSGTGEEIDLSSVAPGLYFWKIVSENDLVSTGKLQVIR